MYRPPKIFEICAEVQICALNKARQKIISTFAGMKTQINLLASHIYKSKASAHCTGCLFSIPIFFKAYYFILFLIFSVFFNANVKIDFQMGRKNSICMRKKHLNSYFSRFISNQQGSKNDYSHTTPCVCLTLIISHKQLEVVGAQ